MIRFKKIFPVISLSVLMACGADNSGVGKESADAENSTSIEVTKAQFNLGKMELGTFSEEAFHRVIKANGILDVPPENKSTISAYFGGYVKNISLIQGQKISKGQTLFTLESPDYIQVQQDYLEAKSNLSYLKSDYERQKELAAENVNSQKTFQKAESDYKITLSRFESLKKKLQLMNINPSSVNEYNLTTTIAVKAPISGFVTSVLATKGMFLNPSDIALTIMNTDHMHVELNIFEQDLTTIKIGQEVSFRLQNGESPYKATVYLINKAIDPVKRTIKVHCHFLNETEASSLTPGMYVEAEIYASSESSLALPVDAVIPIENKNYILVKKKNTKNGVEFEQVEVKVGQKTEGYIEILNTKKIANKAQILTVGAFNLIQE
jgi:cobalt-zinc-cadmium efflux system membrane fusion protein